MWRKEKRLAKNNNNNNEMQICGKRKSLARNELPQHYTVWPTRSKQDYQNRRNDDAELRVSNPARPAHPHPVIAPSLVFVLQL